MKSFAFDQWDGGRLTVNREFSPILRWHRLDTFDALMNYTGGRPEKSALRERTTTRLELADANGGAQTMYLKRHERPPLKERLKPLFRLQWPILGARNEWEAILRFHANGIATMVPVAVGESSGRSFLLTAGIEGCRKLTEWAAAGPATSMRALVAAVADTARAIHAAGMHHQDFYLTHLMAPIQGAPAPVHVLDLGRVRYAPRLSQRWIVKDLAQLHYSATRATASDRLRFLTGYLGRPIRKDDVALIRRVIRKSRAIARHSRKNGL